MPERPALALRRASRHRNGASTYARIARTTFAVSARRARRAPGASQASPMLQAAEQQLVAGDHVGGIGQLQPGSLNRRPLPRSWRAGRRGQRREAGRPQRSTRGWRRVCSPGTGRCHAPAPLVCASPCTARSMCRFSSGRRVGRCRLKWDARRSFLPPRTSLGLRAGRRRCHRAKRGEGSAKRDLDSADAGAIIASSGEGAVLDAVW